MWESFRLEMDGLLLLTLITLTLWHIWGDRNKGLFDSIQPNPIATSQRVFVDFRQL